MVHNCRVERQNKYEGYTMKTLKILAIVAITGLTGTMTLNASNHDCDNQRYAKLQHKSNNQHKASVMKLIKRLDLSDEQKSTLKSTRKAVRLERKAKRQGARRLSHIKEFISVDGFDKKGYVKAAQKRAKINASKRAVMLEKTFAVLTPEQRLELVELLNQRYKKLIK